MWDLLAVVSGVRCRVQRKEKWVFGVLVRVSAAGHGDDRGLGRQRGTRRGRGEAIFIFILPG